MRANVEKMNQAVKGHPELLQKIEAETQRLKNTGEAKNAEEAAVKAVKAVLDIDLDAVTQRGYHFERVDQLALDHLLGVR